MYLLCLLFLLLLLILRHLLLILLHLLNLLLPECSSSLVVVAGGMKEFSLH